MFVEIPTSSETSGVLVRRTNNVPVTIIPATAVRFPGPEADPAEVGLAVLVLAHHVIAAAILLDGHVALGTLLRVRGYPVGRLRIVVTFLYKPLIVQILVQKKCERFLLIT